MNYHPSVAQFPTAQQLESQKGLQQELHETALATARKTFGREVYVRGVVEVSNYCRENCHYCGMRRSNRGLDRYRAEADTLLRVLLDERPQCITDINIQAGEDPVAVREVVIPLVRSLKASTKLGISVCLGTLSPDLTRELQEAGASIYIIKFELANANLYRDLEAPGTLEERTNHIRWLATEGWAISSGFIAGLPGQDTEAALENFRLADSLPLVGCSVSPFIPGDATPLASATAASLELTLNCMAALRIMRPDWVIPAVSALNLAGPGSGYQRGLLAGANLCTINLTPENLREDYLLYRKDRFIMNEERILSAIQAAGCQPSSTSLAQRYARHSTRPELVIA